MSNIFETQTRQIVRSDASIRVQKLEDTYIEPENRTYISVPLLEYHPDFDNRLKFRGRAYVPDIPALAGTKAYRLIGAGYLDTPYREINEVFIHPQDNNAMKLYCRQHDYAPIIIKRCPLPFPMFKKGQRVCVVTVDPEHQNDFYHPGQLATCVDSSSQGGMSTISYDNKELNKGFKSVGIASICLRAIEEGL